MLNISLARYRSWTLRTGSHMLTCVCCELTHDLHVAIFALQVIDGAHVVKSSTRHHVSWRCVRTSHHPRGLQWDCVHLNHNQRRWGINILQIKVYWQMVKYTLSLIRETFLNMNNCCVRWTFPFVCNKKESGLCGSFMNSLIHFVIISTMLNSAECSI